MCVLHAYMCNCCQCLVLLESLEMTATRSAIVEVDRHIVEQMTVDARMGYAVLAGQILLIVRLVCPKSRCI